MASYYAQSIQDILKNLNTDGEKGLNSSEAKTRLEKYGYNELKKAKKLTPFKIFISQFKNALLLLLIFAGILSLILGEKIESIAIFGILLLNAVLGFIQEYRAEKAMEALKKLAAPRATVIRDGRRMMVSANELVPGDIILLEWAVMFTSTPIHKQAAGRFRYLDNLTAASPSGKKSVA